MLRRCLTVGLVLALAASVAAQTQSAEVQPPIETRDLELESERATVLLRDGSTSVAASARTGSLVVWEKRTPCFEQGGSCLDSRSQVSRTSASFDAASVTLEPRPDAPGPHVSVLELTSPGRASLAAGQADLTARPNESAVQLSEDEDAPRDLAEARIPAGLRVPTERGNLSLQGAYELVTTGSELRIEGNLSDNESRRVVTGVSWDSGDDGFEYRTLRLAKVAIDGGLTAAWDGPLLFRPELPAPFTAGQATVNPTEGQLAGANASAGPTQLADLEATVASVQWGPDGGRLVVEQGAQPVASSPDAPDGEGLSGTTVVGGASAAALAVVLTAYYWPRLSWLGAVTVLPLYSRIEKDELFENEVREELYETIQEDPGIHAHALAEAADIGWGTTVYHLRRLERNGFVQSEKRGRYRRFFPESGFMERQREVLSVLQNETTNDIAELVLDQPGLNQSAICEELDISPSLANWHLNRLIDAELVDRERRGRTVHYTPGEAWDALERAADVDPREVLGDAAAA